MTALNLLAVQNAPLLRELIKEGDDRPANVAELARRIDRDESNVRKTVKALDAERLLFASALSLSGAGIEQLEAIDRAETGEGQAASVVTRPDLPDVDGKVRLLHCQIRANPDNDREDWTSAEAVAELEALADDIADKGLLQNLTVVETGETITSPYAEGVARDTFGPVQIPIYELNGGERRWRAIGILIGRWHESYMSAAWSPDRRIDARIIPSDALSRRLAALSENLQRRNLNPLEKAKAFEGLADAFAATGIATDKVNREIADRVGVTIEHVQQHRSFLKLDDKDLERLALPKDDARRLSISEARKLVARKADADAAPLELDLHPVARLILAEMMHVSAVSGRYAYSDHEVGPAALDDPFVAELVTADQLYSPRLDPYGDHAGRVVLRLGYGAAFAAFPWSRSSGEDHAEAVAGLAEEQARFLAETPGVERPEGTYLTPWLNGPFELTEEGRAIREQVEAERAEAAAARAAREAAYAERALRWRAARDLHARLFAVAQERPEAGQPQEVQAIAQDVDRPLPWSVSQGGDLLDANGKRIAPFGQWNGVTDQGLVTAQMIAAAVNATAGLATPVVAEEEEADEPEQDIDGNDPGADHDDVADAEGDA